MKYFALLFILFLAGNSAQSQISYFAGLEGNYYAYNAWDQRDGKDYKDMESKGLNYAFGLNVGVRFNDKLSAGIGYRRGGAEDNFEYRGGSIHSLTPHTNALLVFGRHQLLYKGKIGLVNEVQFRWTSIKEQRIRSWPEDIKNRESSYTLNYIPRFIYYPTSYLSIDIALFQIQYYNRTITEYYSATRPADGPNVVQKRAGYQLSYEDGPILGVHYYFGLKK